MYRIRIEHTRPVKQLIGRRWCVVSQDEKGNDVYGHTPEVESTETVTTEIYAQSIETLDLADVVAVVNGLNK